MARVFFTLLPAHQQSNLSVWVRSLPQPYAYSPSHMVVRLLLMCCGSRDQQQSTRLVTVDCGRTQKIMFFRLLCHSGARAVAGIVSRSEASLNCRKTVSEKWSRFDTYCWKILLHSMFKIYHYGAWYSAANLIFGMIF